MGQGDLYDWNLARCQFLIDGVPLEGFGDDEAFNFEPNADNYEFNTGAGGAGTRSKTNDVAGQATFTLKQTSPANSVLGSFQAKTRAGQADLFSVRVKNLDTGEEASSAKAWVHRPPDLGMAKIAGDNEWIVMSANWKINYGDGFVPGAPSPS